MNKKWWLAILLLVLGLGFIFWWNSDEKIIERRAHAILDAFDFEESDKGLDLSNKINDTVHSDVLLITPEKKLHPSMRTGGYVHRRESLVRYHQSIQMSYVYGKVTNREVTVDFIEDEVATVTAKFHIELKGKSGQMIPSRDEDMHCVFKFKQIDGHWLLIEAEIK